MYLDTVVHTAGMVNKQLERGLESQREIVPESQDLAIHLKKISRDPGMSVIAKGYNIVESKVRKELRSVLHLGK